MDIQPCSSYSNVTDPYRIWVVACKTWRQGKKEKWKQLGTMSTCAIIGKQPALEFRHNSCIVAYTISKSWIMKVKCSLSQISSEKRFLPNLIAWQHNPKFKYVVSGVQDIEYTVDPTLQRCHVWSLERIEIFVASPNCLRIKNWQLECGVLNTKYVYLIFKEHQVSHGSYQTQLFHA